MLGKRLDYQVEENKIHFFFEKEEAFLEVITESIMNVFVPYETKGHRSKAIEGEKAVRTDFEVKDCGSYVSVATKQLEARVYASVLSPERAVFNISADDHHAFY